MFGAAAFGKEDQRQAVLERFDTAKQAGDGRAAGFGVDGDLAGAVEVPADEGDLPERLLGEDAELEGQLGEEDGRVVVAEMVGGVDGGVAGVQVLAADEFDGREADQQEGVGPGARDGVLLAAGFVPKAAQERDAAEEGGGEADQRVDEEIGEPADGVADLLGFGAGGDGHAGRASALRVSPRISCRISPTR